MKIKNKKNPMYYCDNLVNVCVEYPAQSIDQPLKEHTNI